MRRVLTRVVLVSVGILSSVMPLRQLWAQSINPADRAIIDQEIERQSIRRNQQERERERRLRSTKRQSDQIQVDRESILVPQGGPCFIIRKVKVTGYEPFGAKPEGYRSLINHCSTLRDIVDALDRVNKYYQQQGYITTRAYLPEQNLKAGIVEMVVIPGRIEGYVYSNGKQADNRIKWAFPTGRGDLLNLRDLEQGLDNFNMPRSSNGKFQLIPGEKPGGSFVQVISSEQRRYRLDLTSTNNGYRSTGIIKGNGSLAFDNVLGVNDQWNMGIGSTPFEARQNKFSDSASLNITIPYGQWQFDLSGSASRYYFMGLTQITQPRSYYGQYAKESFKSL